jgi:hypothetical protein
MTTSKTIAGLIGPTLVAIAAGMLLNFGSFSTLAELVSRDRALIFVSGILLFVAGLAIVRVRGGQGECEPAKHASDTVPKMRVTGAGAHTASSPSLTQGGSRVREFCTHGSGRGAVSNDRPYRTSH